MTELKFSIYGDQPSPLEDLAFLLKEFQTQQHITLHVERLPWEEAWSRLLNYALHGGGPHVSQIGSIWTSTLVSMNALRPFTPQEIAGLDGRAAFLAPTWQTATLPGQSAAWGIPFTGFTYIIVYRRDLLQRAGVKAENAFVSAEATLETLRRLQAAGIPSPVLLPSGRPFRARVHIAASWLWGAGSHFVDHQDRQVLFDQTEACTAFSRFFQLYHYLAPADQGLSYTECLSRFAQGRAAVTIASSTILPVLRNAQVREVLDNVGAAVLPGVPWIGGSNLVVWREAQMYPDLDRAALALVRFLTRPAAQLKYAQAANAIPARIDTLSSLTFEPPALNEAFQQSLRTGRSYRPILIWVRMVNDLSRAFDAITTAVLAGPQLAPEKALSQHLTPLAQRYNLMLSLDQLIRTI